MNEQSIIDALKWRYATKKFNPEKKIDDKTFDLLLETLRLAPTSFGIQPGKFVVVKNPEIREKLKEAAYGQAQVKDASHLLIITTINNLDENHIDKFLKSTANIRNIDVSSLKDYRNVLIGSIMSKSESERANWATHQMYIGLGFLLEAAALLKIDACPMEGFNPSKFDEILGLKEMGLSSRVMCALGYRDQTDSYIGYSKSRFSKEEVVVNI